MDLRKGMRRTWYEYALNRQCKTTETNLEWAWSSGDRIGLAPQGAPVRFTADAPIFSHFIAFLYADLALHPKRSILTNQVSCPN